MWQVELLLPMPRMNMTTGFTFSYHHCYDFTWLLCLWQKQIRQRPTIKLIFDNPSPSPTPSRTLSFSSTSTYCSLWQCIHVPWCQNTCLRKKIPVLKDWPEWNFVFLVGKRKAAKVRVVCSLLSGGRKGGCKYCKLSKSECQTQCLQRKDCEQMISDWVVATAGIGDHL